MLSRSLTSLSDFSNSSNSAKRRWRLRQPFMQPRALSSSPFLSALLRRGWGCGSLSSPSSDRIKSEFLSPPPAKLRKKTVHCVRLTIHIYSSWIQVTGLLIKTHWIFLKILLFQPGLWVKSLPCLQFQPGLKPSLVTSKQKWCHCHINRELVCSVFQPGLW